jgi:glycosyltransferase involved in cell wall biosynthesis
VTVVRVDDDPGICPPRARNLGAQNTTSPWLCFVDADVKVTPGWTRWMADNLDAGSVYRAAKIQGERIKDTWGMVLCSGNGFIDIGGYDEVFRGWGGEDDDLYDRLKLAGTSSRNTPQSSLPRSIMTTRNGRFFMLLKEKALRHFVNRFYVEARLDLMKIVGRDLPLAERQGIMKKIKAQIMAWSLEQANINAGFTSLFPFRRGFQIPSRWSRTTPSR